MAGFAGEKNAPWRILVVDGRASFLRFVESFNEAIADLGTRALAMPAQPVGALVDVLSTSDGHLNVDALGRGDRESDRGEGLQRGRAAPQTQSSSVRSTGRKIMVVDENAATRRMVRNALQRSGYDVITAADGVAATALMKSEQPRVVLQDLMLPDADGFDLVGNLRRLARGTDVSIIAVSGLVSEFDEVRISTVGFNDIIAKPIETGRLVPLIEAHLSAPALAGSQFGRGRRLVIADADAMQLRLAMLQLSRLGFDVEGVADGRAALAAARRRAPDVVVADVMMPELDGLSLALAMRQDAALRAVPFLLMTSSHVEVMERELARRAGANDLVLRTPALAELLDSLRSLLTSNQEAAGLEAGVLALEREHSRLVRQFGRQVVLSTGLARRCLVLASELSLFVSVSEALTHERDVDAALDQSLSECFDTAGIEQGAIYLIDSADCMRVRHIGTGSDPVEVSKFFGQELLLRDVIRIAKTVHVPSGELDPNIENSLLERANASAMLIVPLRGARKVLGCIVMITRTRQLAHEEWRTFGNEIATQTSRVLALVLAHEERVSAERDDSDDDDDGVADLYMTSALRLMSDSKSLVDECDARMREFSDHMEQGA